MPIASARHAASRPAQDRPDGLGLAVSSESPDRHLAPDGQPGTVRTPSSLDRA